MMTEAKIYSGSEVRIRHADLVRLRAEGKVALGINDSLSQRITVDPKLKPTKTTASAAFHFWNWSIILGFLYSVYLSFTSHWWWFLIGILGAGIVHAANREANQDNMLDAAMWDEDFYEKIAALRGWLFKMEPQDAEPYLINDPDS